MEIIIFVGSIIFILIIGYLNIKLDKKANKKLRTINLNYKSRILLLNKSENIFFNQLLENLPNRYYASTKVRLWDIVEPDKYSTNRITLENKIKSKHIDFVIFEKETSKIILLIELDGKSHLSQTTKSRDIEKDKILESAKLQLLRIQTSDTYDFMFLENL